MLKNIDESLDYIYSFIDLEKTEKKYKENNTYSLDNIKNILSYFNNLHKKNKIIHIAGTKGKGSVSYYISYLLNILGFSTTSFLSPHLIEVNERILFNGNKIENNELIQLTDEIKTILEKNDLRPTTFELFFIVFLLFSQKKRPDYLIIETGLGGRLDCTNIVDPIISVITQISLDHTNILGNSIKAIAYEKAGIIKKQKSVVISKQDHNCINVFKKKAVIEKSKLYYVPKHLKVKRITKQQYGNEISVKINKDVLNNIKLNYIGKHQINNFLTSLLTVSILHKEIIEYLKENEKINVEIPGRIQILKNEPLIILDVAHNSDSAKKLKETLKKHFPKTKWQLLTGIAIGKDINKFYKIISKICNKIIVTGLGDYKESNVIEVFNTIRRYHNNVKLIESFDDAFNEINNNNEPKLITGSFYIAGPFLKKWNEHNIV